MRILIFGDSITQGFFDIEGGWVSRLRKYYDQSREDAVNRNPPNVINLGVSGDKSVDVLNRIENEIQARQWPGEDMVIIINSGVNDSRIDDSEAFCSTETYQKNLENIIRIAKKYSTKVVVLGPTPCDDSRTNPAGWSQPPTSWNYTRLETFNEATQETATSTGSLYIDIFQPFATENEKHDLLPDGLHPNSAGHELIFQTVKKELDDYINS